MSKFSKVVNVLRKTNLDVDVYVPFGSRGNAEMALDILNLADVGEEVEYDGHYAVRVSFVAGDVEED